MEPLNICSRFESLQSARKSLDSVLHEVEEYVVPYRGEFYRDLKSEHEVEHHRRTIYDSTAPTAANLLASQMHGNLTSPAAKWFGLKFRDEDMNKDPAAKEWLEECEHRVWQSLLDSDFNTEVAEVYLDLVSFGTSVIMMEETDTLMWKGLDFTAMPMMDTYFETGPNGLPSRVYRLLKYTRLQLQERWPDHDFDLDDSGDGESDVDKKHEVIFCCYLRDRADEIDISRPLAPEARPTGYQYVLRKAKESLEEGGFYRFPAYVVRWQKTAGSRWGFSPAHVALSDIKQLNEVVSQTSEARAKAIDPPYVTTQRGIIGDLDLVSGGLTIVAEMGELAPLENASNFMQADAEIERLQQSIRSTFFIDKLELKDSPAMTATEVQIRYERMLRLMSPTLGRLANDLLDPLIESAFHILGRHGQLPEQPESTRGSQIDIEYSGPLPRAQKGEQAQGTEMFLTGLAQLAGMHPAFEKVLDIPDVDECARLIAEQRGVPAKGLQTPQEIKKARDERAEQDKAMQDAQMAQEAGAGMTSMAEGKQALASVPNEVPQPPDGEQAIG
jgi:hypothetical protein